MRRMSILLAFTLSLSGCTYEEVNEVSLFKYRRSDGAAKITAKTAGNIVPWTLQAAALGAWYATVGAFYAGLLYVQSVNAEKQSPCNDPEIGR